MNDEAYLRRKLAQQAARLAAYGSINAVTPADYTLKQALTVMGKETAKIQKTKKGDEPVVIDDGATGPIFESEVDE